MVFPEFYQRVIEKPTQTKTRSEEKERVNLFTQKTAATHEWKVTTFYIAVRMKRQLSRSLLKLNT